MVKKQRFAPLFVALLSWALAGAAVRAESGPDPSFPGGALSTSSRAPKAKPAGPPQGPRGIPNDHCDTPLSVSGPMVTLSFDTALATTGPEGQDNPLCGPPDAAGIANDVWFLWAATGDGLATLQSCGLTGVDTKAAVYQGAGCETMNPIACNDNACGVQTQLAFPVAAGTVYTIQIGRAPGTPDGPGQFLLVGPGPAPPNDQCANAQPVSEGEFPLTTVGATTDGPPACALLGADVWYRYTATASGLLSVSTCGQANFDTVIAAYAGTCDAPIPITCNDDACALQSTVYFDVSPGVEYLIRVGGFNGASGDGVIIITLGPPCSISCPELSTPEGEPCGADTNGGCNSQPPRFEILDCDAVICGSVWAADGVRDTDWYRFTLDQTRPVHIDINAELPVVVILFRMLGPCPDLQLIAAAETPPCGPHGIIDQNNLPPGDYLVFVAPGTLAAGIFDGFPCGTRNAYVLRVSFASQCPTQQPFFAGMRHTSLGVAELSPGSIVIDNTGASGTNGAAITVGPTAEGWRGDGRLLAPGPLAVGASIVLEARGTVEGLANSVIGLARIDSTPSMRLRLIPDFSLISATTYRLQAFLGDTEVFSGDALSGPAFDRANDGAVSEMIFQCVPARCPLPPCPQTGPFVPVFVCQFAAPETFRVLPGGPQVMADRFIITPENPDQPVTSIAEVALTTALTGPLEVTSESLVFRRLFHTTVGNTHFDASNDQLGLSSMSDGDGVSIDLPPRTKRHYTLLSDLGDPADPANPIPDHAFIDYTLRGLVNGVPDAVYSSSRYEDIGSMVSVRFDFSNTGTDELQVTYTNGPVVVGTETLAGSMAEFMSDDWIMTLEKTYDECGRAVCQKPCWVPASQIQSPSGMTFLADAVDVVAPHLNVPFAGYTRCVTTFSSIPAVTFETEILESMSGACCACDFNGSGDLNSADFFDFLTCFFGGGCPPGQGADFNLDGVVNSQDFFEFLGCFFSGCP